jgi:hypothetical protein
LYVRLSSLRIVPPSTDELEVEALEGRSGSSSLAARMLRIGEEERGRLQRSFLACCTLARQKTVACLAGSTLPPA